MPAVAALVALTASAALTALALLALALLAPSASGAPSSPASDRPVSVVAGENTWGSVAAQIGGRDARVTSILTSPTADPHLYEATAADAAKVAQAQLVIVNGADYDYWLTQLVTATSHPGRRVVKVSRVLHLTGATVNPHFWYDVPKIPKVAAAIEAALARVAPRDRSVFAANLAAFDRSLRPLDAVVAEIRSRHRDAPVAYTEPVPGYLIEAAGLDNETPQGFAMAIEDGTEPSPAATLAMDQLLTRHKVRVLLYNVQTVSSVTTGVRALARRNGIPVVAVAETLQRQYRTLQAMLLADAKSLLRALGS